MTWSYTPSLLATSIKDAVRLLIGDVLVADPQLQDEEIVYIASNRGSVYGAAADCCRSIAAKYSRLVDQQAGQSKVFASQMAKAYMSQAIAFDNKVAQVSGGLPYAGGISLSDMQVQELNADRVNPSFTVGMTDNTLPVAQGSNETLSEVSENQVNQI